jgi:putative tricarboxylic transport membrane protein
MAELQVRKQGERHMRSDLVVAGLSAGLAIAYLLGTETIPSLDIGDPLGPRAFPILIGICLLLASVLLVFETRQAKQPAAAGALGRLFMDRKVLGTLAAMIVFALVFETLGYLLSSVLFLLALTSLVHRGHPLLNATVSIGFAVVSYLLFDKLLGVALPQGLLGF